MKSGVDAMNANDSKGSARLLREYVTLLIRVVGILAVGLEGSKDTVVHPLANKMNDMIVSVSKNWRYI